jgi:heterodisulfide reductase subunit C
MKRQTEKIILGDPIFEANSQKMRDLIKSRAGQDISQCYQCGKCTAGCASAYAMDITPRQVMRAAQLGLEDDILNSSAIWLCLSCQVCSARCPKNIDIARVMEALRHMAIAAPRRPAEREVALFNRLFLGVIATFGRAYEFGIAGMYNLASGHLFANIDLLPAMLVKGKLAFVPPKTRGKKEVKNMINRVKAIEMES